MLFSLEAVQALHGDSLLVHFGTQAKPQMALIDGGPATVYGNHLKPRLLELKAKRAKGKDPLPIRLMMISLIDDDHINGILALLRDMEQTKGPLPYKIDDFWFNSFDDIVGNSASTVALPSKGGAPASAAAIKTAAVGAAPPPDADLAHTARLVLASVKQGRDVRDLAKKLSIPMNKAVKKKLLTLPTNPQPLDVDGLALTVVAPSEARKDALNEKWDKELKKLQKKGLLKTAAYVDNAVENLSSIVVLAEHGGKTMLLTGDARGDDVLEGLRGAGKLKSGKTLKLNILKLPHHGSIRNTAEDFFQLLPADHYVVSASGKFDNPDLDTIKMLTDVRQDDKFTIHLTNHVSWLDELFASHKKKGRKYKVVHREDPSRSIRIDLGDALKD